MEILSAPDPAALEAARQRGEYVWIDLLDPTDDELRQASEQLGVHPLALEDTEEFSQRPKLDHYGDHLLLVFYGARLEADGSISEVETHLIVGAQWLVTVRRHPCLSLDELHETVDPGDDRWIVYRVVDALTDSYFPVMHEIDQRIDHLEEEILEGDARDARRDTVLLRKPVLKIERVLTAQRDVFDRSVSELAQLPGLGDVSQAYFRDVQDHLYKLASRAEGARPPHRRDPPGRGHHQHPPGGGQRAAVAHRHDLPAADRRVQLLRHELRLDGRPHPVAALVPGLRRGPARRPPGVPPAGDLATRLPGLSCG
jgi:magnesium transporter